jgi:uncharacterized protein YndB with AHSA1/START domain
MATHNPQRATASVVIRAAPEAVFDAWLDPRMATRFLAPDPLDVAEFENEPREGADFRLVMQAEGRRIEHAGRYVVIDRPRRLIFTWISPGTDQLLSLVTVLFIPVDGGVRIDLEHEGLPDAERAARHAGGWRSILDQLAQLLR